MTGPLLALAARCRERGYTLDEVRACIVAQDGDTITVDIEHPAYPRVMKSTGPRRGGPGTELKRMLRRWLGIATTPQCKCNAMAWKMDTMGVEWCLGDGMEEIIGVMREEHGKRAAAGQTILPWSDAGARMLVKAACRRARKNR